MFLHFQSLYTLCWMAIFRFVFIHTRKFGSYDLHYFYFLASILHLRLMMCYIYYILVFSINLYLVITHFRRIMDIWVIQTNNTYILEVPKTSYDIAHRYKQLKLQIIHKSFTTKYLYLRLIRLKEILFSYKANDMR